MVLPPSMSFPPNTVRCSENDTALSSIVKAMITRCCSFNHCTMMLKEIWKVIITPCVLPWTYWSLGSPSLSDYLSTQTAPISGMFSFLLSPLCVFVAHDIVLHKDVFAELCNVHCTHPTVFFTLGPLNSSYLVPTGLFPPS